jgi:pSer/pThr/pTyr-binding forkhead associated (FHA) protein
MLEIHLQPLLPAESLSEAAAKKIVIRHFPCVVGRLPACDQRIDHELVSRRHCVFLTRGDRILVQDLGSRNGTYVNGQQLQSAHDLHDGDKLCLACVTYRVQIMEAVEADPCEAFDVDSSSMTV